MADRLSMNISHFYNTERENTETMDCFPCTTKKDKVASHEATLREKQIGASN